MTSKTYYELAISYDNRRWYPLNRKADDYTTARRMAGKIADGHKLTTTIGIYQVTTVKVPFGSLSGVLKEVKPKQYTKCGQCNTRRKNKNINPKSGICLVCELRNTVNEQQPELV